MDKAHKSLKSDDVPIKFIYITVGLAALLPEYIAPLLTLACFLVFKRHFTLTAQKVDMGKVGKVFLLFMCYSLISALWSTTPIYSAAISLLWMGMLLGSFFISNLITTREKFENLIMCFSLGGGAVGGIALIQYILLMANVNIINPIWSILDKAIYKLLPFTVVDNAVLWATGRSAATFDNPLILATYLVIIFPLAIYGFVGGKKKNRTICGICALLILGGIISTASRGPALALVAMLIILAFVNSKKAVGIFATLFSAVFALIFAFRQRDSLFERDLDKSTNTRLNIWKASLKVIGEKPIFGHGAGCEATSSALSEYGVNRPHAHSLFLELSCELGLVGLVFFLVVLGFLLYDIIKLIKIGGIYRRLGVAFIAAIVGFIVSSTTEFTMQTPKELQFFMLFLGTVEAAKRIAVKEPPNTAKPRKIKHSAL